MTGVLWDILPVARPPVIPGGEALPPILVVSLTLAAVMGIETLVLHWRQWGTWRRCLRDAVIVNAVTALIGGLPTAFGVTLPLPQLLAGAFLLSVIVEAALLYQLGDRHWRTVVDTALLMNIASYLPLMFLEWWRTP